MSVDDKGRMLHGRLEFFDRNVTKLTKHMSNIIGHHQEGVDQGMRFSARVKNIAAQEPFADLQDRLVALAEITERIALERKNIMCDRAQSQVLQKLEEIKGSVIAPTKMLLRDRDGSVRALVKAEQRTEENGAGASVRGGGAPLALVEQRHQLKNTETTVDNNMELFEVQRTEDLKEILDEFLRCEMYYHCRALEVLAPALMHVAGIDGEAAGQNIREEIEGINKQLNYNL